MNNPDRLHFISRAFPPLIGGIENQNYSIYLHLKKHFNLSFSINRKGKNALPFFLPFALFRILILNNKTPILLGDGVLTILPWFSQFFLKKNPIICVVHGLDITYNNKLYQWLWVNTFFHSVSAFIAVSKSTRDILISKGIDSKKIFVVPNGFDFNSVEHKKNKTLLSDLLNINLSNKFIMLTLGRLVKRKGVDWFLKNVIKQLDEDYIYIIAGDGPEKNNILKTIEANDLSKKVIFCGRVSEEEKKILLSNCHIFIQPNIPVEGDIEGFGISVIEASAFQLPVIASNLEGLKEAIIHKKNGWLVAPKNTNEFIHTINNFKNLSHTKKKQIALKFQEFSKKKYEWKVIIRNYIEIINHSNEL